LKYNCYDPTRPSGDYASGDHKHYQPDGTTLAGAGDVYLEACRMKRVDGVYRAWQDWRLKSVTVLSGDYLTSNATNYGNYVEEYVADVIVSSRTDPTKLVDPGITLQPGAAAQLYARGLYIDDLPATFWSKVAAKPDDEELLYVPYYDINLTKLADWDTSQSTGSVPCTLEGGDAFSTDQESACAAAVRNDPIVDEGLGEVQYWRGKVVGGVASGTPNVFGYAKTSTTGITGSAAIDPDDASTLNELPIDADSTARSEVAVTVSGSYAFSGDINKGNAFDFNNGLVGKIDVEACDDEGDCEDCGVDSELLQSPFFSCSVPAGWTGAVHVTESSNSHLLCGAQDFYVTEPLEAPSTGNDICLVAGSTCAGASCP